MQGTRWKLFAGGEIRINRFAMPDGENPDLGLDHPEDDAVVAHEQFPVPFQRLAQRFAIIMRRGLQPLFDCPLNPFPVSSIDEGQILIPYGGMIAQRESHRSFPHVFV